MDRSKAIGFVVKTLSNQVKRQIDISVSKCEIDGITGMQCWIIDYLCDNVEKKGYLPKRC
ncbi:hypothetical protein [Clostridium sp.]|uniref:hypothetical protein n=1 Tax=Clostridium sp. TaxID=1506 RepID=UPI00262E7AE3|nr:hypothetical protein [uncultured Clostridium sp.]